MTDENELRRRARDGIERGALPATPADRTWGGPGANAPCAVCGQRVAEDSTGFELEFARPSDPEPMHLAMHTRCFAAWESARDVPDDQPARRANSPRLPSAPDAVTVNRCERDRTESGDRE